MVFYTERGDRGWMRIERVVRVSMQHEKTRRTAGVINGCYG
jgi:hypothetical protein